MPHLAGLFILALLCALILIPLTATARATPPVTGHADPDLKPIDDMMLNFLEREKVPAASLAITHHGKLVYARAFGYADIEKKEPAQPNSLFRLASVSKPITAVAVMQLVQQGKIDLDKTRPFADLAPKPILTAEFLPDPRLDQITIRELLQNRGGFDRAASLDPMFQSVDFAKLAEVPPPAMQNDIIRVMAGRPLDFPPGDRYAYSNFGYCVLGREIEHVTGETYENYLQKHVLNPLGITDMHIGRSLENERFPNEVKYYMAKPEDADSVFPPHHKVPLPYGAFCLEAMDAHGAWIATASDVVKFASEFDAANSHSLLHARSIAEMFARPPGKAGLEKQEPNAKPADVYYACGWQVRPAGPDGKSFNAYHTGALDGTSTLVVRRWDGFDWAVLFNQRGNAEGQAYATLVDPLIHQAVDSVKSWPQGKPRAEKWP